MILNTLEGKKRKETEERDKESWGKGVCVRSSFAILKETVKTLLKRWPLSCDLKELQEQIIQIQIFLDVWLSYIQ